MDVAAPLRAIPLGALLAVLILLPLLDGLIVFSVRTRASRKGVVSVTAWILTAAAALLFVRVAGPAKPLYYTPGRIASLEWGSLVLAADLALLVGFVAAGIVRRHAGILLLAVAQLAGMAWLEFASGVRPPPGPAFYVDWLATVMVLIVSIIGSTVAVYALPYMKEHEIHQRLSESRRPQFFLTTLGFLGAMNGLVLSNNLLWLCFFWEVTTLCSFLLIAHDGTEEAVRNSNTALWMNLLGGLGFVAALALLEAHGAPLTLTGLLALPARGPLGVAVLLPMALLCFAGFTKAAQMPFQNWLLGAMVAPTPVSALLHSSTMVKAGVYLIVRLAPTFHGTTLSQVVAISGAFSFVTGAMLAIGQTNAKRVLAYSTISNLGLIIACAGLNTPLALTAAVMLIVFHAISKGLLFMAAGVVEHGIWSRDIEDMRGLVSRMPLTTAVMVIGILSMLLPPFGVLIAKLAAIEASVHLPGVLVLLVLGSTFTVVFWTKWMGRMLTADPTVTHPQIEHLHNMYFGPLLLLTAGAIVFSLFVGPLITEVVQPAVVQSYAAVPMADGARLAGDILNVPWAPIMAALAAAVLAPLLMSRHRPQQVRGAYMCGAQSAEHGLMGFVTVAEQRTPLTIGGFYFTRYVGEQKHVVWITAMGVVLVALMFGVVVRP